MNHRSAASVTGLLALLTALASCAQAPGATTIRLCDDTGCAERPRDTATFQPAAEDPETAQRLAALTTLARQDPRAAYDLGLRFYRGDGVRQDSYQALRWMREAAERGDAPAQLALGRFYLAGLEEMGSDPAEAEKWLGLAAARGDAEAKKLLAEASAAKRSEAAHRRWLEANRAYWLGWWHHGYFYRGLWRGHAWYFR